MKKISVLTALSFLPGLAFAEEGTGASGFSLVAGFFQMMAALAIVLGVIFFAYSLANRFIKRGGLVKKSAPRYIRVIESRFLGPKKSLMLVEVGGEYLLLGSTDSGLNLIKHVDMLENVEVVEDLSAPERSSSFRNGTRSFFEILGKKVNGSTFTGKRAV